MNEKRVRTTITHDYADYFEELEGTRADILEQVAEFLSFPGSFADYMDECQGYRSSDKETICLMNAKIYQGWLRILESLGREHEAAEFFKKCNLHLEAEGNVLENKKDT